MNMAGDSGAVDDACGLFDVELNELVNKRFFNGMSMFRVIAIDQANPDTHVIAEHTAMGYRFPIAASIVQRYLNTDSLNSMAVDSTDP
jgi:hypothetical protein